MEVTDEIREKAKMDIDHQRHVVMFGREKADAVMYFWLRGYEKAIDEIFNDMTPRMFGYYPMSEVARKAGCTRQYVNKVKDQLEKMEYEGKWWYKPFQLKSKV